MGELLIHHELDGVNGNVNIIPGIILADSADDATASPTYEICETAGENLSRPNGLKRQTLVKIGTFRAIDAPPGTTTFVNFRVRVIATNTTNKVKFIESGSQLTVLRFTPVNPPFHGVEAHIPPTVTHRSHCRIQGEATSCPSNNNIYRMTLNSGDLQAGDIIIATGEAQAWYTGSTSSSTDSLPVWSKIRLRNSTESTSVNITRPNEFSMKGGQRSKATMVKAAAYAITAPPSGTYWKYLEFVAWSPDLSPADCQEPEPSSPPDPDDQPLVPGNDSEPMGKLSLIRFRHAGLNDDPVSVTRYDREEYNDALQEALDDPMEKICDLAGSTIGSNPSDACSDPLPSEAEPTVVYEHTLSDLQTGEALLVSSELHATSETSALKTLGSGLIAHRLASGGATYIVGFDNATQVHQESTHHIISTKVACERVAAWSGFVSDDYAIRRVVWATNGGFDGHCGDEEECDPDTGGYCNEFCDLSNCEVIGRAQGRLSVLRFTPRTACFADCAPANNPDGMIDVDDLLAVINNWGPVSPGTWGDVTDNNTVDVDDLLAVINKWGTCEQQIAVPATVGDCFDFCESFSGDDWEKCMNGCLQSIED